MSANIAKGEAAVAATECPHCSGEQEPGWIETPNNGPIVPCPLCNPMTDREREFERALAARAWAAASNQGRR